MISDIRHQVLLASIYIPVFWAIVIMFTSFKRRIVRFYLLCFFINIGFVFFMTFLRYHEYFQLYTVLFPFQAFAVASSFPLFYLYINTLTSLRAHISKNHLYHFIFAIFMGVAFFLITYVFMSKEERYSLITNYLYNQNNQELIFKIGYLTYRLGKIAYVFQSVIYFYLLSKIYNTHNKNIAERFSANEGIDLSWLKIIGIFFLFVFIFNAIMHLLKLRIITNHDLLVSISYTIFNAFCMAVGILTIRQKEVYGALAHKYEYLVKDKSTFNISKSEITEFLQNHTPYTNSEFSIYDLCLHFNTNRTYMSSFINKSFNINFRTLINSYRISDAKEIIRDTIINKQQVTFELIALQVGFQSYSTFLRVFKHQEGITPFEYREKLEK